MQVDNSNVEDTGATFTCNTCGLTFPTADLQRLHMRTDWHRYNLKRKVAQLPPITSEMFAEKMLQQEKLQQAENDQTGRGSSRRSSGNRQVTKKDRKKEEKLAKRMADMNMNKNKKAQEGGGDGDNNNDDDEEAGLNRPGSRTSMVSSTFSLDHDDDAKTDELHDVDSVVDEDEQEENEEEKEIKRRLAKAVKIPANVCLVDGKEFDTVERNAEYMRLQYGLIIPEQDYLVDLKGLMEYLGEKIGLGNVCLYCNYQGRTVEAVRQHMVSKGHVKIPYETMDEKLELADFYDFRSSYKPKKVVKENEVEGEDDDDDWEDEDVEEVSDFSDDDELDDEEPTAQLDDTGYELQLASGHRAGHRHLARYYRQNLRPEPVHRDGQGTVLAVNQQHMLRVRDPVQQKEQKRAWVQEKKAKDLYMKREKKVNFQKHFRDELLQ